MYSRYSGVSIPKNYGGSRFSNLNEPETKTHRAKDTSGASKASRSPSFVPIEEQAEEKIPDDVSDFEAFLEDEPIDEQGVNEPFEDEADKAEDTEERHRGYEKDSSSFLKSILSGLERDELILLGLILLLISDRSQDNTDIVMILALLLVSR